MWHLACSFLYPTTQNKANLRSAVPGAESNLRCAMVHVPKSRFIVVGNTLVAKITENKCLFSPHGQMFLNLIFLWMEFAAAADGLQRFLPLVTHIL